MAGRSRDVIEYQRFEELHARLDWAVEASVAIGSRVGAQMPERPDGSHVRLDPPPRPPGPHGPHGSNGIHP